jgi:predicted PurR-regulated permease PerM
MRSKGWKYPEEDEMKNEKKKQYTHAQMSSMVMAIVICCYSLFFIHDIPLAFLTGAFVLFMLNPVISRLFGETIGKVAHAFSVTLIIGSFILAFL